MIRAHAGAGRSTRSAMGRREGGRADRVARSHGLRVETYAPLSRREFMGAALLATRDFAPLVGDASSVLEHGAAGDGETDDSEAFQAAIFAAYERAGGGDGGAEGLANWGGGVWVPPTVRGYALASAVILLPGVHLLSFGAKLLGLPGTPRLLETGVLVDGVAVSNVGAAPGVHSHHQTRVSGLRFAGQWASEAIRLHNAIRGSSVEHCYVDVPPGADGIVLTQCFTMALRSVHVEGIGSHRGATSQAGIRLSDNCNNAHLSNVYSHNCEIGLKASGCQGLRLDGAVFERSTIGIDLSDESRAVSIEGCYLENNRRGIVIGAEAVTPQKVMIDSCFFALNEDVDIDLVGVRGARIGEGNFFDGAGSTCVRSSANALHVLVDHGVIEDGAEPWLDISRFQTHDGLVIHRALQTAGHTTTRTAVRQPL